MANIHLCAFLFVFAQLSFAQHVIRFERASLSVTEEDTLLEVAVELFMIDGGGGRLDGEEIIARISTSDITARAPEDYMAQTNIQVMFTDGSAVGSFQTVNFTTIFEDAIPEIDETFVGVLQPSNTALGDTDNFALGSQSTITVTIVDDDVVPVTIGLRALNLGEGTSGQVCASIMSGSTAGRTFVINYVTSDGTASVAAGDYVSAAGDLTFSDTVGSTSQCFTVQTRDDSLNEDTECFNAQIFVTTTPEGLTLSPASVPVCIMDNDDSRVISVSPAAPFTKFIFNEDVGCAQICVEVDDVNSPSSIYYRTEELSPVQAEGTGSQAVDRTVEEDAVGTDVVLASISKIDDAGIFTSDRRLLRRIARVETADGVNPPTTLSNGGIWNVPRDLFLRTQTDAAALSIRQAIRTEFSTEFMLCNINSWETLAYEDLNKPLFSALAARLVIFLAETVERVPTSSDISGQAAFWLRNYNTAGDVSSFTAVVMQLTDDEVCSIKSDIIFLLDTSGSVGAANFRQVIEFTLAFVRPLDIGPDEAQVGVILFNDDGIPVFDLDAHSNEQDLLDAINNINFVNGGTNIAEGLCQLLQGFSEDRGARLSDDDVFRLALVVTDGQSSQRSDGCGQSTIAELANRVNNISEVFSIGVGGGVNQNQLLTIAGGNQENVVELDNFDATLFRELSDEQTNELCFRSTIQIELGQRKGTLERGGNVRYELEVPVIGATTQLCMEGGAGILYASRTVTSPNEALHDYRLEVVSRGSTVCADVFVSRTSSTNPAVSRGVLYISLNGIADQNQFCLTTSGGDSSTPDDTEADYVSVTGMLLFTRTGTTRCASITIIDDELPEDTECFNFILEARGTADIVVPVGFQTTQICIRDNDELFEGPPSFGDDPHFAIFLPSGKLLCYTVQGEHGFVFNLISNDKVHMNALFVPDSRREEVTWIGSLGIVVQNAHFQHSNTTRLQFDSKINQIHINDKVTLEAKNIDTITFRDGKLTISEGPVLETFHYPSVRVNLDDLGMQFTVNFTGEHLDMIWNKLEKNQNSHGIIGQFFHKGVEIDAARKLLLLPDKAPVPVMRKPVWAYMEHNVPSDQLCWVAMNPGYQGRDLIDGHYLDYVVDNLLSTDFKFECKHKY